MEKEQNFKIQTEFRIKENIQFLFIDNYIISVKKLKQMFMIFIFIIPKILKKNLL